VALDSQELSTERKSEMMYNNSLDRYIFELSPGLERTLVRVLKTCRGYERRITKRKLMRCIASQVPKTQERAVRAMIARLRKEGVPICSTAGAGGGYWYAATPEELDEFINRELKSKIKDMRETVDALQKTRMDIWGDVVQVRMF